MQAIATVAPGSLGRLIGTTDLKQASRIGKKLRIGSLIRGTHAHYEVTKEGTVLIYAGRELYELEVK